MASPSSLDLEQQLCFALYAASNELVRAYRPLLAEIGLTYPQYLVMLVLWQDGAQNLSAIAKRLRLSPNAITPLVDRLEQGKLVRRYLKAGDRRQTLLIPTAKGKELKSSAAAVRAEVACKTGLSETAMEQLIGEIGQLLAQMDDHTPGAPSDNRQKVPAG